MHDSSTAIASSRRPIDAITRKYAREKANAIQRPGTTPSGPKRHTQTMHHKSPLPP